MFKVKRQSLPSGIILKLINFWLNIAYTTSFGLPFTNSPLRDTTTCPVSTLCAKSLLISFILNNLFTRTVVKPLFCKLNSLWIKMKCKHFKIEVQTTITRRTHLCHVFWTNETVSVSLFHFEINQVKHAQRNNYFVISKLLWIGTTEISLFHCETEATT